MSWGIYVHVPWCRVRCPYCSFYVEKEQDVDWPGFVDAVLADHGRWRPEFPSDVPTISLGGGTPSRMPTDQLKRLLEALGPASEISLEANPEDVDASWLESVVAAGVDRISLGIQTFDAKRMRLLNRAHTTPVARQVIARVAASGLASWSIDVIFGLPDQSAEEFRVDLEAILEVSPPHVSVYGLTFEPGTPFQRALDAGKLVPCPPDIWRAQYDLLVDRLSAQGLHRYEVSNFARQGQRSQHNLLYWTDAAYMGLGPSAHGYAPDGRRWVNVASAARYTADPLHAAQITRPSPLQAAIDLVLSSMRSVEGLDLDLLQRKTQHRLHVPSALEAAGLITTDSTRVRLTSGGFPVADAVTERLIDALQPMAD